MEARLIECFLSQVICKVEFFLKHSSFFSFLFLFVGKANSSYRNNTGLIDRLADAERRNRGGNAVEIAIVLAPKLYSGCVPTSGAKVGCFGQISMAFICLVSDFVLSSSAKSVGR